MTEFTAIEIKHPKTYELIQALMPDFNPPWEEAHLSFLVLGYPEPGKTAWLTPAQVAEFFDHIENGLQITLKQLVK